MNIKTLLGLFLLMLSLAACKQTAENHPPELWGWVHADAKKSVLEWELDFKKLNEAGFKGILIGANPEVLKTTIPIAKYYGLEVHAWMWTMNRGDADSSWLSVNQLGNSLAKQKAYVE